MVGEGVEDFHSQSPLPEWFVTVQEPYQHGQEDLTLCDLRGREGERERGRERGSEGGREGGREG